MSEASPLGAARQAADTASAVQRMKPSGREAKLTITDNHVYSLLSKMT